MTLHPNNPAANGPLANQYDQWHQHRLDAEQDRALDPKNFACWHQMVTPRLGDLSELNVAEIGCGRGNFAIFLAQQGARITAMDFSEHAIEIARDRSSRTKVNVDWQVGDAQDTKLPSNEFDLVISCECMEHVPDPKKMMAELSRILKPGGRLFLTTPSQLNAQLLGWAHAWITRQQYNSGSGIQPHENLFFTWQIKRWMRKNGLRVELRDARVFPFLLLPKVNPRRLRFEEITVAGLRQLARPFGLHQLYVGTKCEKLRLKD